MLGVSTPQFRRTLVRKLKNLAPGFDVEFLEAERAIAFQIKDAKNRVRSSVIRIYRNTRNSLTGASLKMLLHRAGFPDAVG